MDSIVTIFTDLLEKHGIIIIIALSGYAMAAFGTIFHLKVVKRFEDQDKYLKEINKKLSENIDSDKDDYKTLSEQYHKEMINILEETTETMNDIGNKFEILKSLLINKI